MHSNQEVILRGCACGRCIGTLNIGPFNGCIEAAVISDDIVELLVGSKMAIP